MDTAQMSGDRTLGRVQKSERPLKFRTRGGARAGAGRPRKVEDVMYLFGLRAQGLSWRAIGKKLRMSPETARRAVLQALEAASYDQRQPVNKSIL